MTRSERERINDILRAINSISQSRNLLKQDADNTVLEETVLSAVTYQLFVIGEAVKTLSPEFRDTLPEVPWRDIIRQRDLIGHHYFRIESSMIWATIDQPLAKLEGALSN